MNLLKFLIELGDRGVSDLYRNGDVLVPVVDAHNARVAMEMMERAEEWIRSVMTPRLHWQLMARLTPVSRSTPINNLATKAGG